jgi:hypothetical protein
MIESTPSPYIATAEIDMAAVGARYVIGVALPPIGNEFPQLLAVST